MYLGNPLYLLFSAQPGHPRKGSKKGGGVVNTGQVYSFFHFLEINQIVISY